MKKVICGIIGGVGPSASAQLYSLINAHTPAEKDQDHLRLIIDSHPQIPDRTQAILHGGESPEEALFESAQILKNAGADFIAIPCNTAHYFMPKVAQKAEIELVNMIEETGKTILQHGFKKVGILSTSGTAKSKIYQQVLEKLGIITVIPDEIGIEKEMEAIYGKEGIKASTKFEKSKKNKSLFVEVIDDLEEQGAEAIIMGCTEIPLCLENNDSTLPLINPTEILAKAIIKRYQELREHRSL